ncbi:hypothetical protein HF313_13225 [Massilia atriviolacea]|uniref:Uncharacterized protein n=1 Tax=Massilia atriviolacea TaxID=2495579 RepID=A0A430HQB1_9BURK|nr:hypothetical protein [Massilia atriviolacea]RSZ59705.1 hypothetical protein EJB06_05775 [Massilia atriviolacea]
MTSLPLAHFALPIALLAAATPASVRAAPALSQAPVPPAFLKTENIAVPGKLVKAARIEDATGEHLLVVSLRAGPSAADNATPARVERYDFFASLYTRKASRWARAWLIEDVNDCPTLDSEGQFFPKYITVTDLDQNGIAEVTVPYKFFCGGGVDSSTLKVIMRQGAQKFAARGQTLVGANTESAFGGELVFDPALSLRQNAVFKAHLQSIRDKVYIEH